MNFLKSIWSEILEIKSDKKQLREFGIVMGVFFGIIAGLLLWKGRPAFPLWAGISVFFFVMGLTFPMHLKPLQKIWMALAVFIGWFMSRIILSVLFFLILTPISLIARATGKKFLDTQFRKNESSYWIDRSMENHPKERYEKQF